jgi:hypothetical protein
VLQRIFLAFVVCALACASAAQAHIEKFRVFEMSGALEDPMNNSEGFGTALITFDLDLFTMRVETEFGGLTGTTTNAHIHCCELQPTNAIVATRTPTFLNFPMGVTAGTYDHTYDMTLASSYNPAFITAHGGSISQAFEDLLNGARAGNRAYLNIHSSFRSGGEIRGYLEFVPEPSTCLLTVLGLAGSLGLRRRR